jgi:hypothetical protein
LAHQISTGKKSQPEAPPNPMLGVMRREMLLLDVEHWVGNDPIPAKAGQLVKTSQDDI